MTRHHLPKSKGPQSVAVLDRVPRATRGSRSRYDTNTESRTRKAPESPSVSPRASFAYKYEVPVVRSQSASRHGARLATFSAGRQLVGDPWTRQGVTWDDETEVEEAAVDCVYLWSQRRVCA